MINQNFSACSFKFGNADGCPDMAYKNEKLFITINVIGFNYRVYVMQISFTKSTVVLPMSIVKCKNLLSYADIKRVAVAKPVRDGR